MVVIMFITLFAAAYLEITGDSRIADALAKGRISGIPLGWLLLGAYGVVVNGYNAILRRFWGGAANAVEFSHLLGVYIAVFATMNLALSLWRPDPRRPVSDYTIIGTVVIICGGIIIQFGADIVRLCRLLMAWRAT